MSRPRPQRTRERALTHAESMQEVERQRRAQTSPIKTYLTHHLWVAVSSLGYLSRTPFATLLTAAVIAIALALPVGLYVALKNVQQLSSNWETPAQVTLFLKMDTNQAKAEALAQALRRWPEVKNTEYISPARALSDFQAMPGFGEALKSLDENPLPPVVLVQPAIDSKATSQVDALVAKLRNQPQVDAAELDTQWLQRLQALIRLGKRGVLLLSSLLGVAVLLVIGNTIRLAIFNRRQEIVVTKLIGGTNAFIRRPFLYTGVWYGLTGALLAWVILRLLLGLLESPVDQLSQLYSSQFRLLGVGLLESLVVFATGISLGLLGAWVAATRHLQSIEPR